MKTKVNVKRIISAFLTALLLAVSLIGCEKDEKELTPMEKAKELFNVSEEYSKMTLEVNTFTGGVTLSSSYTLTREGDGLKVNYSVQVLSTFDITDNGIALPEGEYVRTVSGIASVNGTQVSHQSGEPCPYDLSGMTFPSFTVNENTVQINTLEQGSINIVVTDPKTFFGTDGDIGSNITVQGSYSEDRLDRLSFSATISDRSSYTVRMNFTK